MAFDNKTWKKVFSTRTLRVWSGRFARLLTNSLDRFGFHQVFTSLWRRIVFINMLGLIFFVAGVFYLSGFRASLLDLKIKSLEKQGEIIAAVISAANSGNSSQNSQLDINTLLSLYPDNNKKSKDSDDQFDSFEFPLDPQKITPLLQKTVQLTNTRARVYEADGTLSLDSNRFIARGLVIRALTPKNGEEQQRESLFMDFSKLLARWIDNQPVPRDFDAGNDGRAYEEVRAALAGTQTKTLRINDKGHTIVSVATPIKNRKSMLGVLLLTTKGVEIDTAVATAREEIIRVAIVALVVSFISSFYLTGTIAGPMRDLSKAAKDVKSSIKTRHEIPDLTHRPDEIGQLSGALREMTSALYKRLEAIESFAADVSHELKNPLTSLRSAVETLPLAKRDEDREHLIEVILNDVSRLNRLITDISSASRLDAELARDDKSPLDMLTLVQSVADVFNDIHRENGAKEVIVDLPPKSDQDKHAYLVYGHDTRLGQVFTNLLDNALSFTCQGGRVWIRVRLEGDDIRIVVEDEGPGIPEDNLEKIFARFYTDRPGDLAFRENSGLGLNISQQIVVAHNGGIWAENRYRSAPAGKRTCDEHQTRAGARFVVKLPAIKTSKER